MSEEYRQQGVIMCFRPSPVKRNDSDQPTCQTCGMPVGSDDLANGVCPYCGDPIPADPPDDFSDIDPIYSTRII